MIEDFTVMKAGGAGFALSALNPKNMLLTVAAATEIVEADLPASREAAVLAVFVLIASAGVLAPLVLTISLGDRSRECLTRFVAGWRVRTR